MAWLCTLSSTNASGCKCIVGTHSVQHPFKHAFRLRKGQLWVLLLVLFHSPCSGISAVKVYFTNWHLSLALLDYIHDPWTSLSILYWATTSICYYTFVVVASALKKLTPYQIDHDLNPVLLVPGYSQLWTLRNATSLACWLSFSSEGCHALPVTTHSENVIHIACDVIDI